jgi:hypothetical protein
MPAATAQSLKPQRPVKRLAVTDENLRRVFGMDRNAMFSHLAKHLGYDLEG